MKKLTAWCRSPIGWLKISATPEGISAIDFGRRIAPQPGPVSDELARAVRQLEEYFRGERREFELSLAPAGTDFQKRVWAELKKIPFGRRATYGRLAAALGKPGAARAVGGANHLNPIAIIIPCHRVIGAGADLRGYGGGLWRKRWLLDHERSAAPGPVRQEAKPRRRRR